MDTVCTTDTCWDELSADLTECVYGLRYVECNGNSHPSKPWSLRQCVIYNKTDHAAPSTRWLLLSVPQALQNRVDEYLNGIDFGANMFPFDVHWLYIDAAIALWRPYLVYLSFKLEKHVGARSYDRFEADHDIDIEAARGYAGRCQRRADRELGTAARTESARR